MVNWGGLDSGMPQNEMDCYLGVPRFEGPKPHILPFVESRVRILLDVCAEKALAEGEKMSWQQKRWTVVDNEGSGVDEKKMNLGRLWCETLIEDKPPP